MNPKRLLILTVLIFLIASQAFAQSGSMSLDHVDGLYATDSLNIDVPVIFYIRMTNNFGVNLTGFTTGFRVYSLDGANWTSLTGSFTGTITPSMMEQTFVNHFSNDGLLSDTVGFAGFRLFMPGIPNGFDDVISKIQIGPIDQSFHGKTICLDSSYYRPAGAWAWSSGGADRFPNWDGPHCFTIIDPSQFGLPKLNPIGNKSVNECELLEFTVSAVDTSGNNSTPQLSASPLPNGATFVDNEDGTGTFSWSPDVTQSGNYDVEFVASLGPVSKETVTITVNNNQAPTITASGPFTVYECQEFTFSVPGNDPEGQTLNYTFVNEPSGSSLDANTGLFTWTPSLGDASGAPYIVTFTAEDACGESASIDVTFNMNPDQPPAFNSTPGPFSVDEGILVSFTLDASDPENSAITYSTVDPDMPGNATLNVNTGAFNWMPVSGDAGIYTITFTATDACGQTADVDVLITVATNAPPVFTPVDPITKNECDFVEITVSAVDPDGNDAAIRYSMANKPADAVFDSVTGVFAWTPTNQDADAYALDFIARDEVGTAVHLIVDLTINDDGAPIINGGLDIFETGNDTTILECDNDPLTFTVTAVDPEGTPVGIILVDNLPAGATFNQAAGIFVWSPAYNQGGEDYTIKFRAVDECGTETPLDVNVTVDSKTPPALEAIANQNVNECSGTLNFDINVIGSGAGVTYKMTNWSSLPGSAFDADTRIFTWAKPDITTGIFDYVAKFLATDACGKVSDTLFVNIHVNPATAPVLESQKAAKIFACETITYQMSSKDSVKSYNLANIPTGAVFNTTTGKFTWKPTTAEAGKYTLKFTAKNSCGSVSDTLAVAVEVVANTAPAFKQPLLGDSVIFLGTDVDSFSIVLIAKDPDNFRTTYYSTPLPAGGHLIDIETNFNDSAWFVWYKNESPSGHYEITFYAQDICGALDSVKLKFDIESIITGVDVKEGNNLPFAYYLNQNYPNPFNPSTIIEFGIPEKAHVHLAVYNVLGQQIKTLVNDVLPANGYIYEWNGIDNYGNKVASGIYMYKLITDVYTETKKMIMLK